MSAKYNVGIRVRKERLKYGLSLSELAKSTGLSASFLSLLENGKTSPSLKVLDKLCTFFSIHMATLFEEEADEQMIIFPEDRQIVVSGDGIRTLRFLLPKAKAGIEPVLITLNPGPQTADFTSHQGVEFGYVLEGTIEVHIEGRSPAVCSQGDSILYRSSVLHKLVNPSNRVARGLWMGVPGAESL